MPCLQEGWLWSRRRVFWGNFYEIGAKLFSVNSITSIQSFLTCGQLDTLSTLPLPSWWAAAGQSIINCLGSTSVSCSYCTAALKCKAAQHLPPGRMPPNQPAGSFRRNSRRGGKTNGALEKGIQLQPLLVGAATQHGDLPLTSGNSL